MVSVKMLGRPQMDVNAGFDCPECSQPMMTVKFFSAYTRGVLSCPNAHAVLMDPSGPIRVLSETEKRTQANGCPQCGSPHWSTPNWDPEAGLIERRCLRTHRWMAPTTGRGPQNGGLRLWRDPRPGRKRRSSRQRGPVGAAAASYEAVTIRESSSRQNAAERPRGRLKGSRLKPTPGMNRYQLAGRLGGLARWGKSKDFDAGGSRITPQERKRWARPIPKRKMRSRRGVVENRVRNLDRVTDKVRARLEAIKAVLTRHPEGLQLVEIRRGLEAQGIRVLPSHIGNTLQRFKDVMEWVVTGHAEGARWRMSDPLVLPSRPQQEQEQFQAQKREKTPAERLDEIRGRLLGPGA
jgi:hypothetical protein